MNKFSLLSVLALFFVSSGCSVFDAQCDLFTEVEAQLECLDQAFMELRADADTCYDGRRSRLTDCEEGDEAERGESVYFCRGGEWYAEGDEDVERNLETKGGVREGTEEAVREEDTEADEPLRDRRAFCEGLEADDEGYERCQAAMSDLDGLHVRTREGVERSSGVDERRQAIRRGLRAGRILAG
ncbi:MAG TPA: hypothetical protein DIU15_13415, partial [Deltaproteobacteria bacterium]|nr:hypothetical protein [Deltaproteobacteria bacterium]